MAIDSIPSIFLTHVRLVNQHSSHWRLKCSNPIRVDTWDWKFMVTNGDVPEQRSHHTAALSGNRLIVFGGLSQEGKRLNDLHVLDLCS
jgi:hypothetical protein